MKACCVIWKKSGSRALQQPFRFYHPALPAVISALNGHYWLHLTGIYCRTLFTAMSFTRTVPLSPGREQHTFQPHDKIIYATWVHIFVNLYIPSTSLDVFDKMSQVLCYFDFFGSWKWRWAGADWDWRRLEFISICFSIRGIYVWRVLICDTFLWVFSPRQHPHTRFHTFTTFTLKFQNDVPLRSRCNAGP